VTQFVKKPVVVEAVQYQPGVEIEGLKTCTCNPDIAKCEFCGSYFIETLEGKMKVSAGDWIITGVAGERYSCREDIFRSTYYPLDADGGPTEWPSS
jgi:hypothetical protein